MANEHMADRYMETTPEQDAYYHGRWEGEIYGRLDMLRILWVNDRPDIIRSIWSKYLYPSMKMKILNAAKELLDESDPKEFNDYANFYELLWGLNR